MPVASTGRSTLRIMSGCSAPGRTCGEAADVVTRARRCARGRRWCGRSRPRSVRSRRCATPRGRSARCRNSAARDATARGSRPRRGASPSPPPRAAFEFADEQRAREVAVVVAEWLTPSTKVWPSRTFSSASSLEMRSTVGNTARLPKRAASTSLVDAAKARLLSRRRTARGSPPRYAAGSPPMRGASAGSRAATTIRISRGMLSAATIVPGWPWHLGDHRVVVIANPATAAAAFYHQRRAGIARCFAPAARLRSVAAAPLLDLRQRRAVPVEEHVPVGHRRRCQNQRCPRRARCRAHARCGRRRRCGSG